MGRDHGAADAHAQERISAHTHTSPRARARARPRRCAATGSGRQSCTATSHCGAATSKVRRTVPPRAPSTLRPAPAPAPAPTQAHARLRVRAPRGLAGLRSDCLGPAVMTQCGAAGKLALWVTHNGSTVPTKAACTLEFRAAWSLCRAPYSRNTHPYCDNTHPYSRKCTLIPEIHTLSNDNTHRCSRNTHPYSALPCSSR